MGDIFNYRYNDPVLILKKAVDEGRFGVITNASIFVPWWRGDDYYKWSRRESNDIVYQALNHLVMPCSNFVLTDLFTRLIFS